MCMYANVHVYAYVHVLVLHVHAYALHVIHSSRNHRLYKAVSLGLQHSFMISCGCFYQLGASFGRRCNQSATIWGSLLGSLMLGDSHIRIHICTWGLFDLIIIGNNH